MFVKELSGFSQTHIDLCYAFPPSSLNILIKVTLFFWGNHYFPGCFLLENKSQFNARHLINLPRVGFILPNFTYIKVRHHINT